MDRASLKRLVTKSTVLSPEEKDYWHTHLPTMSTDQCARLEEILGMPDEMPFAAELEQYFSALNRAAASAVRPTTPFAA